MLKEVYVNLLDQKEPKFNLENSEVIDYSSKQDNNFNNKKTKKIIIKPSKEELQLHKEYLKSNLSKNYY